MKPDDWHYRGDIDLRQGGIFCTIEKGDDVARIVKVTPYSDEGGPDNLFRIDIGDVPLDDATRTAEAFRHAGASPETATVEDRAMALEACFGMEVDETWNVRIGPVDTFWQGRGPNPEPDRVLRDGTSLRNHVAQEHLNVARAPKDWGPRR